MTRYDTLLFFLLLLDLLALVVNAEPSPAFLPRSPASESSSAPIFQDPLASTSTPAPTRTSLSTSSAVSSSGSAPPVIPTNAPGSPGVVPTPFPAPFDLSLSFNFATLSCQSFFLNFTQDASFRRCRPFSLLYSSSAQFTQSLSNATLLNEVIWGTCNTVPTVSQCQSMMDELEAEVKSQCATELNKGNELASQALVGFQMYGPMRQAACLVNENDNSYCFVDAALNTSPADLYFYQLPYGDDLPPGTVPTCSPCIKSVLAVYASAVTTAPSNNLAQLSQLASSSLPLDHTYGPAAQVAAQACGSVYAQQVNLDSSGSAHKSSLFTLLSILSFGIYLFSA